MTDKQKQAILAINKAKEAGTMSEEDYLLLMEFIMDAQHPIQYVPWPIETPSAPARYPWEGPWVTFQTTSTTAFKSPQDGK